MVWIGLLIPGQIVIINIRFVIQQCMLCANEFRMLSEGYNGVLLYSPGQVIQFETNGLFQFRTIRYLFPNLIDLSSSRC